MSVESVNDDDVEDLIHKLNLLSEEAYRLPTEEELEHAARGGKVITKYAGSNKANEVAWFNRNSENKTHKVGKKQNNDYGLYDMSGNVEEWTKSEYQI